MTNEEFHPFRDYKNEQNGLEGGFIPKGVKILITGTFPPKIEYVIKGAGFFFFSSSRNHLWNRFDNIFFLSVGYKRLKKTKNFNAEESYKRNRERKQEFLTSQNIGFIDVISKTKRLIEDSSKDTDLFPTENIVQNGTLRETIIKEDIKRICCVYSLAYFLLKTNLINDKCYNVQVFQDSKTANGEKLIVDAFGKSFEVVLLFPATRSVHLGILKDDQYKYFITD